MVIERNPVRRMYRWVLSWADTPYGAWALFILAFTESSVFPIPPDVLLLALCLGDRAQSFRFALICTAGSALGGLFGYALGWGFWSALDTFFYTYVPGFTEDKFLLVKELYDKWDFWIVFVAAFTPIPYKIITIAAGVFSINLIMFTVASIVGRAARFYLVAGLLYKFGEPMRDFIERWFNLLTILFVVLLIGGFYALRLLGH